MNEVLYTINIKDIGNPQEPKFEATIEEMPGIVGLAPTAFEAFSLLIDCLKSIKEVMK